MMAGGARMLRCGVHGPGMTVMLVAAILLPLAPAPARAEQLSVTIEHPFSYDVVAGVVNISGASAGAEGVQVSVDNGSWWDAMGVPDWHLLWNSSNATDGGHSVQARAFNGSTYDASARVAFSVNNTPPAFIELSLDLAPQTVNAGEQYVASGLARFDNGVRISGATVQLSLGPHAANATTDRRGYYYAALSAPADPGRTAVRALLVFSNLTGSAVAYLEVTLPAPPDLSVSAENLSVAPEQPGAQDEFTFTAIVNNLGGTNASARVRFSTDGRDDDVFINVSATGRTNPSVKWALPAGNHTVTVQLQDISPADANSSNNEASRAVRVLAWPELSLAALVFSNSRPTEGMTITLQARLSNFGGKQAECNVSFYDGAQDNGTLLGGQRVTVPANGTRTVVFNWNATKGQHNITAVLSDPVPVETRLQKPELSRPLKVSAKPSPEATSGFDATAAVCGISLAVIVTFASRRGLNPPKK